MLAHVQVTEWLPRNNINHESIESSLLRLSLTRASATCMPSTHQMEAVVVGNLYVTLLAQMQTDYSTPVVSLLVGQHYRATRRVFGKKKFSSLSPNGATVQTVT